MFFQTRMGQIFFEGTMPRLYRAIGRLADVLGGRREYKMVVADAEHVTEKGGMFVLDTGGKPTQETLEERLNELGAQGFVFKETLRTVYSNKLVVMMERVVPREEIG